MIRKAALCSALTLLSVALAPSLTAQTLHQTLGGCGAAAPLRTIQANPSNYRTFLAGLKPGDRLLLAAGTYTAGLRLQNLNGQPGRCIAIEGPASGSPAVFVGSSAWNTVSLTNVSYFALRNLTLDGMGRPGDGVKAELNSTYAHHVNLERPLCRRRPAPDGPLRGARHGRPLPALRRAPGRGPQRDSAHGVPRLGPGLERPGADHRLPRRVRRGRREPRLAAGSRHQAVRP